MEHDDTKVDIVFDFM